MLFHVSGLYLSISCLTAILSPALALTAIPISGVDLSKSLLSDLDFATFNPSTTTFAFGKHVVPANGLPGLKNSINIPLPGPSAKPLDAIKGALPAILKDGGVDPKKIAALTTKFAPMFDTAAKAVVEGKDLKALARRGLIERGFLDDLKTSLKELGQELKDIAIDSICSTFAMGALPAYMVAAAAFDLANPSAFATTADQQYFIHALHGPIYKDGIKITYTAKRPPFFGNAAGTAFGKRIYITPGRSDLSTISGFKTTTELLLHEFAHTTQYKKLGYSLQMFGLSYLSSYCAAGFSYAGNIFEKEAFDKQDDVATLLTNTEGQLLFKVWKAKGISSTLGMPTAKTFATPTVSGKRTLELKFEFGALQVQPGSPLCFRIVSNADLDIRAKANCNDSQKCPPGSIIPRNAEPQIGGNICNFDKISTENEACKKNKAALATMEKNRPFNCNVGSLPAVL